MQFSKDYRIEKAAAKESGRYSMSYLSLRTVHGTRVLAATNGHILAIVPVLDAENDTDGLIPVEAVLEARKEKKAPAIMLEANGTVKVSRLEASIEFRRPDAEFPRVDAIIPPEGAGTVRIGLNAASLYALAQAIGTDTVVLEIQDAQKPVRITGEAGAYGVIMPWNIS